MGGEIILYIFIFIVVLLIFLEYRNEKKYQEQRRKRRQEPTHKNKSTPSQAPQKVTPRPEPKAEVKSAPKPEPKPEVKIEPKPEPKPAPKLEPKPKPEPKPEPKAEQKPEPKLEAVKETKKLPEANYPKFTHIRLVEMGLSDEEAKEFVAELIPQIEEQFPLIEKAMQDLDFHQIERLTHGIKGSATNLGTGGVSDLLVDYNTYLKTGTDIDIARAYFEHLEHYNNELKAQYA
jgi:HPt (histidine-containing phosphotransfer) domain-containing protein